MPGVARAETTLPLLSELLAQTMEEQGVSIRDLSERLGITYEHIRRLVRGEGVPSRFVLKMICDELKMDFHESEKLATADKIRKKYGTIPLELSGKKPGMESIERAWDKLTPTQQIDATTMIVGWAKRNSGH